jgi:hypothetical protein
MIKNYVAAVCFLLLVSGVFLGCTKKSAAGNQAFAKAAPEIKTVWDQAVADDQTNNYVAAITGYHNLMTQKARLTDEQIAAVNAAALAINQRLYAAANNGDAAAKEASLKLAAMQNQR